jgi:hypothetical protein
MNKSKDKPTTKNTLSLLVRKRTIPTERPPLFWRNLLPTFADRGVSLGQLGGSPTIINLSFLDRSRYFSLSISSFILTRAEWTPFQTHCYSENLVAPEIECGTSGSLARKSDYYTTEAV